ncbi:MAG: hypothetical protein NDJ92_15150 [Thermoanaerobaculia bacterium]|nr:hypothetical protein [Thermoanaerobaculia bacterium]
MYLTGLTQRDRLFELSTRWLAGHPRTGDGRFVTEVFLLDPLISRPAVEELFSAVLSTQWAANARQVRTKDELRRWLMSACRQPSERSRDLLSRFRLHAEQYFPTTPVDAFVLEEADVFTAAMIRIKSITRLAEKAARLATARITKEAQTLAVVSDPSEASSQERHVELERQICEAFELGQLRFEREDLRIDDLIGVKLAAPARRLDFLEWAIKAQGTATVVERTSHRGRYNDRQLVVEIDTPPVGLTIDRLLALDWSSAAARGIEPDDLRRAIPQYVESGARSFTIEIILTTWEELLESEFGQGMHEERVLRQRETGLHRSQTTTSVALALTHLLLLAVSPTVEVGDLPIRMTGRYLPETAIELIAKLYGLEIAHSPCWTENAATRQSLQPESTDVGSSLQVSPGWRREGTQ